MKSSINISLKLNRQEAKQQGFYDGRFASKVVKDKKKESNKRWCRSTNPNTYGFSSTVE